MEREAKKYRYVVIEYITVHLLASWNNYLLTFTSNVHEDYYE